MAPDKTELDKIELGRIDKVGAPLAIRRAVLSDAERVAELSGVLGYPVDRDVMAHRLGRILGRTSEVVFVATMDSEAVIGWLHGAAHELLETGAHGEILGLVVDANYRKLGAGRRLIAAVEAWCSEQGLGEIAVRSNVVRTESHPFYERLGYRRVKTQHAYRKALDRIRI
jgi:GNAT superfamily N-acetyltransferase